MKNLVLQFVKRLARRQGDQAFFERLQVLALRGMNIGRGEDVESSGELQVFELLLRLGVAEPVVFDVGANVGHYSLAARKALGPAARIFAFEPSATAREQLETALADTRVEIVQLALGHEAGAATLHADAAASGLASLYPRAIPSLDRDLPPVEDVQVERLDAYCARREIDHIDLLKLDVEGHELRVLEGAGTLLAREAIDLIQFEFGGCNIDSRTYLRDFHRLLSPDYRIFRILAHGLRDVGPYRETSEVFTTTNFLACRRSLPIDV